MLFNSHFFIFVFFPFSLLGYFFVHKLKKPRLAGIFLILMSFWFYASNDIRSLPVLIFSIMFNYYTGKLILKTKKQNIKKLLCITGVVTNILILGVFKYFNFFMQNVSYVFGYDYSPVSIILPLGISFFTFQQISYLIDIKNGNDKEYSLCEYSIFASFFPYITSGPISFHSEIIPQLRNPLNFRPSSYNLSKGLTFFAFGLFKKAVVADPLGAVANSGWANVYELNGTSAIVVILSYSLQLYFDFAGYSDMASGIALCFNIKIPMNFDSPYKARNIADFWQRWHMTMTRFFTKYLYIPLGGSRKGLKRTLLNTFIIFVISGLWHGAAWTFIFWGMLHGIALVIQKFIASKTEKRLPYPISWFFTFVLVNIFWVFFRAPDVRSAIGLLSQVNDGFGFLPQQITQAFLTTEVKVFKLFLPIESSVFSQTSSFIFLFLATIGAIFPQNIQRKLENFKPTNKMCFLTIIVFFWGILSLSGISTFLYFTF